MKNIFTKLAMLTIAFLMSYCGGPKYGTMGTSGAREVKIPCDITTYDNDKYFVGGGMWTQIDLGAASEGSVRQARANLAASVAASIKSFADQYTKEINIDGDTEIGILLETRTTTGVDQVLRDSYVDCKKVLQLGEKTSSGKIQYRGHATVLLSKEKVINSFMNSLNDEDKEKLQMDADKFRERMNEAFNKD